MRKKLKGRQLDLEEETAVRFTDRRMQKDWMFETYMKSGNAESGAGGREVF